MREVVRTLKKRIIVDNDGGDVFGCKSGSYEDFIAARLINLPSAHATTLFYTTISSGFSLFSHRTKIGSVRVGQEPYLEVNRVGEMLERGTDCLEYVSRFCRESGIELFWGMRMNDTHDGTGQYYSDLSFQQNKFKHEHPECLLGAPDRYPRYGAKTAVNYAMPLVREMAFGFVREVLENYDVDGVHLDFFRHPVFFPTPANGEHATEQEISYMTGLVRRISDEVHSRGKLLSVRVPDDVPYSRFLGLDVEDWLRCGLVDLLSTAGYIQLNDWEYSCRLGHRYNIPVYASLDEIRPSNAGKAAPRRNLPEVMRARADDAMGQGCDGILFFNYIFDSDLSKPDIRQRHEIIAEATSDTRVEHERRTYYASYRGIGNIAGGAPPHRWFQHINTLTPVSPLAVGGEAEVRVFTGGSEGPAELKLMTDDAAGSYVTVDGETLPLGSGEQTFKVCVRGKDCAVLRFKADKPFSLYDVSLTFE
ncbi:MAG: hypothetical protein IKI24_05855 [Clostridia bacterium]|nr:hypothetical protein [Clostridia bacterium]